MVDTRAGTGAVESKTLHRKYPIAFVTQSPPRLDQRLQVRALEENGRKTKSLVVFLDLLLG